MVSSLRNLPIWKNLRIAMPMTTMMSERKASAETIAARISLILAMMPANSLAGIPP